MMTDNEIIKALKCLHKRILKSSFAKYVTETEIMGLVNALDLINRRNAEIERLRNTVKTDFLTVTEKLKLSQSEIGDIRAEAIKEFEDKAIKRICERVVAPTPTQSYIVERCNEEIHNLVKELTEKG